MKFFISKKLAIVSFFIFSLSVSGFLYPLKSFAQVSDLANPNDAEAFINPVVIGVGAVSSMYDLWCSASEFAQGGKFECETHRQSYISSLIQDLVFDTIMLFVWGQASADVFTKDADPKGPLPYSEVFATNPESIYAQKEVMAHGRIPFGYGSMVSSTALAFQSEPPIPTDMALFINDSFNDTMLGTPAFAVANPLDVGYKVLVLEGWKITRNLALTILGLILAIVGLMIIFRSKIAPQVTISVYNVLPTLPLAIGLIVLSYPLISLLASSIDNLLLFSFQIGTQIIKTAMGIDSEAMAVLNADGNYSLAVVLNAALRSPYELWEASGKVNSVTFMFFIVGLLLSISLGSFYFLWNAGKIFVSLIITTIVSPLICVLSILPGKQGLILNMIKRVIADVLALPAMVIGAYIGFAIIAYNPLIPGTDFTLPGLDWTGQNAFMIPMVIKGFIGLGFLFQLHKIRKGLESNLGVGPLFGGGGDAKPGGRR